MSTGQKALLIAFALCLALGTVHYTRASSERHRYRIANPWKSSTAEDPNSYVTPDPQSDMTDCDADLQDHESAVDVENAEPEVDVEPTSDLVHGLRIVDGQLVLEDWNAWMEDAAQYLRVTLEEGDKDPEVICTNLFRRMFPQYAWPPAPESPLGNKWQSMVAAIGRTLNRPFRPHFEIVS